jgi:hypothetical protein
MRTMQKLLVKSLPLNFSAYVDIQLNLDAGQSDCCPSPGTISVAFAVHVPPDGTRYFATRGVEQQRENVTDMDVLPAPCRCRSRVVIHKTGLWIEAAKCK